MITYAKTEKYDIRYEEFMQEFFICSKNDNRPSIGGFAIASDAIEFAEQRVVSLDKQT